VRFNDGTEQSSALATSYLSGITSNVQSQLDALAAASSSSSSSIAIDSAANIASDTNKASQVIGTGEFYFNTTNQLRVQYKTGASSFHDFFLATLDTTSPVVTLTGSASVTHQLGATYTDAGATATDNALMAVLHP
jgi:hypothetical protein